MVDRNLQESQWNLYQISYSSLQAPPQTDGPRQLIVNPTGYEFKRSMESMEANESPDVVQRYHDTCNASAAADNSGMVGFVQPYTPTISLQQNPDFQSQEKREIRLQKNRIAARESRRKKKEYIKLLENRVNMLESQNAALINEVLRLKICRGQITVEKTEVS